MRRATPIGRPQLTGAILTFIDMAEVDDAKTIMVVGHNDGFSALASLLRRAAIAARGVGGPSRESVCALALPLTMVLFSALRPPLSAAARKCP